MRGKYRMGVIGVLSLAIAPWAHGLDKPCSELLKDAIAFSEQGRYQESITSAKEAYNKAKQISSIRNTKAIKSLTVLGDIRKGMGSFSGAEMLYSKAVRSADEQFGQTHPLTQARIRDLVSLYMLQGKYSEAETLLAASMTVAKREGRDHDADFASLLNSQATIMLSQGKMTEAKNLFEEALDLYEMCAKYTPDCGKNAADVLFSLASIATAQDDHTQAVSLYNRAMEKGNWSTNFNKVQSARILCRQADVYRKQNRVSLAAGAYRRVIGSCCGQTGFPDPWIMTEALVNLADIHKDQKSYSQAEGFYRRALLTMDKQGGPYHATVSARVLRKLAECCEHSGQYSQAGPLYKQALLLHSRTQVP